ncbi:MAG: DNA-directed RNA polymerase subunit A'' [Candidatus Ranarchaeia archaeon]
MSGAKVRDDRYLVGQLKKLEKAGALPLKVIDELQRKLKPLGLGKKQVDEIIRETVRAYDMAKVEPGEGVGTVAAQSIGEPGTQMSLSYDERVIVRRGRVSRVLPIGVFVDGLIGELGSSGTVSGFGGSVVCDVPDGLELYVPGLCSDEKVRWRRLLQVSRHPVNGGLLRIKTRSGREITATFSHSFVVRKDNRVVPVRGADLVVGDRLPVVASLVAEDPLCWIGLGGCLVENVVSCGNGLSAVVALGGGPAVGLAGDGGGRGAEAWADPGFVLGFDAGWFIGAYLAGGSCSGDVVVLDNVGGDGVRRVQGFVGSLGLGCDAEDVANGRLSVRSAVLSELVKGFCGAADKQVPGWALNTGDEFAVGLIRGFFDVSGDVSVDADGIHVCFSSRAMRDDFCLLLSRLGIFSCKGQGAAYLLSIPVGYVSRFLDVVGSDVPARRVAAQRLVFDGRSSAEALDMVPGFGGLFQGLVDKGVLSASVLDELSRKRAVSRGDLRRYIARLEEEDGKRAVCLDEELAVLRRACDSDVVWDEIVSLERVSSVYPYVYDFTVSEVETFITGEGLVTHNTLRTFHFAGVAEFNVTLGLPRLIEIVDARKNPSTPTMEVYLLPEYRKDEKKAKRIGQNIIETKIVNVAREIVVDLVDRALTIELEPEMMSDRDVKAEDILNALRESRVFKAGEIEYQEDIGTIRMVFSDATDEKLQKLRERLKNVMVKGVRGITRTVLRRDNLTKEWIIYTQGSNMVDVLMTEGVDATRTTTNSIQEIADVLGIEAARSAIISEAMEVLEEQGLDVDVRHIMLVADLMTAKGDLRQIGRHGISGEKESVLARASFEVTVKHILAASVRGERDSLKGIAENVIVGQMIPLGTGTVNLLRTC